MRSKHYIFSLLFLKLIKNGRFNEKWKNGLPQATKNNDIGEYLPWHQKWIYFKSQKKKKMLKEHYI